MHTESICKLLTEVVVFDFQSKNPIIQTTHPVLADINQNTKITNVTDLVGTNISYDNFRKIIDVMLLDGIINWGRIAVIYAAATYTVFQKKRHPFYFYDNFVRCRPI